MSYDNRPPHKSSEYPHSSISGWKPRSAKSKKESPIPKVGKMRYSMSSNKLLPESDNLSLDTAKRTTKEAVTNTMPIRK